MGGRRRTHDQDPPPLSSATEDRIWAEVERRIALGPAGRTQVGPAPDRRPLILSAALVACALGLAGLLVTQRAGPPDEVATATGVAELTTWAELGQAAGAQPAQVRQAGEVLSVTIDHRPTAAQETQGVTGHREQLLITGDGKGQRRVSSLPGEPESPEGGIHSIDHPRGLLVAGLTPDQVATLPGDPAELRASLAEAHESQDGSLPPYVLLELLAVPVTPPEARAGVVTLLSRAGAEIRGPTTDALGRPGLAVVARADGGERVEAVLDPATATLLSLRRDDATLIQDDPALALYRSAALVPDG